MAYGRKSYGRAPYGNHEAVGNNLTVFYNSFTENAFPFLDTQDGTVTTDITSQAGRLRVRTSTGGGYKGVYWLAGLSGTPLRPGAKLRFEVRNSTNSDFYVQETVGYSTLWGAYNNSGGDVTSSGTVTVPANGQLNIVFTATAANTDAFLDFINVVEVNDGYASQNVTAFTSTSAAQQSHAAQSFNSFTNAAYGRVNAIYYDDFSVNRLSEYTNNSANNTDSIDNGQLKIALSAAETSGVYHDLTVTASTNYQIRGKWRMDGQASTWVGVKVWDTTGAWTKLADQDNTSTSSTTELTEFCIPFTTTTNALHYLEPYASSSQTTCQVWFDELGVEPAGYRGNANQQITGLLNIGVGTVSITGSATQTTPAFTNTASGSTVTGTATQNHTGFTNTASGAHGVAGSAAETTNAFTNTASGEHRIDGTATQSVNNFTNSSTGTQGTTGSAAQTVDPLTNTASGDFSNAVTGTATQTHSDFTSTASGEHRVNGTAAQIHSDFTNTASGTQGTTGTASQTVDSLTNTASGLLGETGSAAQTVAALTNTASGAHGVAGAAAESFNNFTNTATGSSVAGTAAQSFSGFTNSASAEHRIDGTAAQSFNAVNTASGSSVTGTAAQSVSGFTNTADGVHSITGSATQTLNTFTNVASGSTVEGTASQSFNTFTSTASGVHSITGSATQSVDPLVNSASGLLGETGSATQTLDTFTNTASGTQSTTGTASQSFNDFTNTASGEQAVTGTAAQSFNSWTNTAEGSTVTGSATQVVDALTNTASGTQGTTGAAVQSFDAVNIASGAHGVEGSAAESHTGFTSAASGLLGETGSAAQTVDPLINTASGAHGVAGTATESFSGFTNTASGSSVHGTTAQVIGAPTSRFSFDFTTNTTGWTTQTNVGTSFTGTDVVVTNNASNQTGIFRVITGLTANSSVLVRVQCRAMSTQAWVWVSDSAFAVELAYLTTSSTETVTLSKVVKVPANGQLNIQLSALWDTVVGHQAAFDLVEVLEVASGFTSTASGVQSHIGSAAQSTNSFTNSASGEHRVNGTATQSVVLVSKTTGSFNVISFQNFDVSLNPYVASDPSATLSLDADTLKTHRTASGSAGAYNDQTGLTVGSSVRVSGRWKTDGQASTQAFVKVWETVTPGWTKIVEEYTSATSLTPFSFLCTVPSDGRLVLEVGSDSIQTTSDAWFDDLVIEYNVTTGSAAQSFNAVNIADGSSVTGTATQTLTLTQTASGVQITEGSAAQTVALPINVADGLLGETGSAAQIFGAVQSANGEHRIEGTATQTLTLTQSASGVQSHIGSAAQTVVVQQDANGSSVTGSASQTVTVVSTSSGNHSTYYGSAVQTTATALAVNSATGLSNVVFDQPFTSNYLPFTQAGSSSLSVSGDLLHIIPGTAYQGAVWNTNQLTPGSLIRVEANGRSTNNVGHQAGITLWDAGPGMLSDEAGNQLVTEAGDFLVGEAGASFAKLYETWSGTGSFVTFTTTATVPVHGTLQLNIWGNTAAVESAQFDWVKVYYVSLTSGTAENTVSVVQTAVGAWDNVGSSNRLFNSFVNEATGSQTVMGSTDQTTPTLVNSANGAVGVSGSAVQTVNNPVNTAQGYYDIISFQNFNTGSLLPWYANSTDVTLAINSGAMRVSLAVAGSDGATAAFTVADGNALTPGRKVTFQGRRKRNTSSTTAFVKIWETVTPGWTKLVDNTLNSVTYVNFSFTVTVPSNGELVFNIGPERTTANGTADFDDLVIVYDPGVTGSAAQTIPVVHSAVGHILVDGTAAQTITVVHTASGVRGVVGSADHSLTLVEQIAGGYTFYGASAVLLDTTWVTMSAAGAHGVTGSAVQTVTEPEESAFGSQAITNVGTTLVGENDDVLTDEQGNSLTAEGTIQLVPTMVSMASDSASGTGAQIIPFPTQSATGQHKVGGTAEQTVTTVISTATGVHSITGSAVQTTAVTQTANGTLGSVSTAHQTVTPVNQNASGTVPNNALATQTLAVDQSATGTQGTTGTADQTWNPRVRVINGAEGGASRVGVASHQLDRWTHSAQGLIGFSGLGVNDIAVTQQAVGHHGVQSTNSVFNQWVSDGRGGHKLFNPVLNNGGKRWGFRY